MVAKTPHFRALPSVQVDGYLPHSLHAERQVWPEKNCYVDVWIELLHALELEPTAAMGSALAVDFEGDQWTFFKPPLGDLRALYGVNVQELTVWRPLLDHAIEYLAAGKLISTEADAFWLPDTVGTDYRRKHTKTTIILNDVDLDNERLSYFHNASYYSLEGEDFRGLFRFGAPKDSAYLPLYAELIRCDRLERRSSAELAQISTGLLRQALRHRPRTNPMRRFGTHIDNDFAGLQDRGLDEYHAWAFATTRQCGAAFDLSAAHLRWLSETGAINALPAAASFEFIAQTCKAMILKAARAVNSGRPLDASAMIEAMAQSWDSAMASVELALKR